MNKKITIITTPPIAYYNILKNIIFIIKRYIKKYFWFLLPKNKRRISGNSNYGGHYAVTRSIIEGIKKIGEPFNYNPVNTKDISQIVYVPGGLEALKYAIELKKNGIIKKLITGPNIAVFPDEIIKIKDYKYIDLYLQPSDWVINLWKNLNPNFPLKLETWCAGVDTNFWKPTSIKKNKNNILLYKKFIPQNIFLEIKDFFIKNNFNIELLEYGSYTEIQYLEALNRNSCIIHMTESESQGLSLAEAWSTNTPTIVWNPTITKYKDVLIKNCSSAPYLTKETGEFFKNLDDLKKIFLNWNPEKYSPRKWVISNMSDEICAQKLITIINNENTKKIY
jgi:hypothetical protein